MRAKGSFLLEYHMVVTSADPAEVVPIGRGYNCKTVSLRGREVTQGLKLPVWRIRRRYVDGRLGTLELARSRGGYSSPVCPSLLSRMYVA